MRLLCDRPSRGSGDEFWEMHRGVPRKLKFSSLDTSGRELGRSVTDSRGSTTFYDAMGRTTGRSVTSGGTTTVYDNIGRQTGTVRGSK